MKKAIIYLDNEEKLEMKLCEILENEVEKIEERIISNKFFKYYNQYINMLHIIKIEVVDDLDYWTNWIRRNNGLLI